MNLTFKQINIIALVLLFSHNLCGKCSFKKQDQCFSLTLFRLIFSIICGIIINIIGREWLKMD